MRFPKLTKLRLWSQTLFFLLFAFLLLRTEFRGSLAASGSEIRLPYPVGLFFRLDPLVAISNALASHALYRGLLRSLVILIPTMFLGRFFCGWICPLGSIHHFFSSFKSERKRGKQLIESNRYKRWQTTKYYLLIVALVAAMMGTGIVGWLDPFSFLVRSLGLSIVPATNYGLRAALSTLEHSRFAAIQTVGGLLHFILGAFLLSFKRPYFRQGVWVGLIFIFIVALNFRITRFWCRAVCPLGALLGLVSRWSLLGLVKTAEHCNDCNRCLLRCQGGDDPPGGVPWHQTECHLCLNCVDECPEHSLQFKLFPAQKSVGANLQRRKVLTGLAAGVSLVPLVRATPGFAAERHERLLRPPCALDEEFFLSRCIRFGECMKVCPNDALHPTWTEAGVTLGMKNWYGMLGGQRNQLHQKIHESLVDLADFVRPTLTMIDCYRILLRNGPTGGNLENVLLKKTLVAGTDPVALDAYVAKAYWNLEVEALPYLKMAANRGLGTFQFEKVRARVKKLS